MSWAVLAVLVGCKGVADVDDRPAPGDTATPETGSAPTGASGDTGTGESGHTASSGATADTADPAPTEPGFTWVAPPASVPPGGFSQDHATAALRPDGTGVVVYSHELQLRGVRVEPNGALVATPTGPFTNHGQVAATPEGFVVVATNNYDYALYGLTLDAAGVPDQDVVLLSTGPSLLADVDVRAMLDGTVAGVVATTDRFELSCIAFTDSLQGLGPTPCPTPVDPTRATGTVAVVQTEQGPLYTWTEVSVDQSLSVFVGNGVTAPVRVGDLGYGAWMAGRPMLAVGDDDVVAVVYRGATTQGQPVGSYLWHTGAGGVTTWSLGLNPGGTDVERVAVTPIVGERFVVGWEESDQLWLQVRSSVDGAPLGIPSSAGTDPLRVPRRPSLDLVLGEDDGVHGIVSWESAEPGSAVEDDGRIVRIRRFRLDDQP